MKQATKKLSFVSKLLIFGVVPALIFLTVYLVLLSDKPEESNRVEFKLPENSDPLGEIDNKGELYDKYAQQEQSKEQEHKQYSRVNVTDLISIKGEPTEKEVDFEEKLRRYQDSIAQVEAEKQKKVTTVRKTTTTKRKSQPTQAPKKAPSTTESSINESEEVYYGFSSISNNNTPASVNSTVNNNTFFMASLEGQTTIKKSQVNRMTFILREDATLQGQEFMKGSVLNCEAKYRSNIIDIVVTSITDTKGNNVPITLYGHDKQYQRGIAFDATWDDAFNESLEDGIEVGNSQINNASRLIDNTARNTKRAFSKSSDNLSLYQGYKMYFK